MLSSMIHITSLTVPPGGGWVQACYCAICKRTVFVLNAWAAKPGDGDYWLLKGVCENARHTFLQNMGREYEPWKPLHTELEL